MNEDLINSAVSFLSDPNVASSPLTKKVEFLESKGLNQQEIEEALNRANASHLTTNTTGVSRAPTAPEPQPPIDYYNMAPPPLPERSWKDYFIMATATAGVTYGLYQVVSKYLIPSIIPPSQSSIEDDKARVDEEFIKIDKLLEQLSTDQSDIKEQNESKLKEIDVVIENVNDFLAKYNKDKLSFDDDLRLMKSEIQNLKNSVEKNMDMTKDSVKFELSEITAELDSLKQLLRSRGAISSETKGDGPSRKLAPVSSIPSASDILKRAKEKKSGTKESEASEKTAKEENGSTKKPEVAEAASNEKSEPFTAPGITKPVSVGGVTAAGIPEWQLKDKEKQLEEPSASIPSWQQQQKNSNDIVKDNIANIGVPLWQLNAQKNTEEEATQ